MGWQPCRKCGDLRKIGDFTTEDGEHVPVCQKCGDPEYYETTSSAEQSTSIKTTINAGHGQEMRV